MATAARKEVEELRTLLCNAKRALMEFCASPFGLNILATSTAMEQEVTEALNRLRAAKKRAYDAVLAERPAVLDATLTPFGPSAEIKSAYPCKADWFASLTIETRLEVTRFGAIVTRATMRRELYRVMDEDCDNVFYDYSACDFEWDIDLAANLVDDGEEWIF